MAKAAHALLKHTDAALDACHMFTSGHNFEMNRGNSVAYFFKFVVTVTSINMQTAPKVGIKDDVDARGCFHFSTSMETLQGTKFKLS